MIFNTIYNSDKGIVSASRIGPTYTIGNLVYDTPSAIGGTFMEIYHNTVFNFSANDIFELSGLAGIGIRTTFNP